MSRIHLTDNREIVEIDAAAGDQTVHVGECVVWGIHVSEDASHAIQIQDDTTRLVFIANTASAGDQLAFDGGMTFKTSLIVNANPSQTTGILAIVYEVIS